MSAKPKKFSITFDPAAPSSVSFLADLMDVGDSNLVSNHEVEIVGTEKDVYSVTDLYPCVEKVEAA